MLYHEIVDKGDPGMKYLQVSYTMFYITKYCYNLLDVICNIFYLMPDYKDIIINKEILHLFWSSDSGGLVDFQEQKISVA